jgi:signal transduction histidine kinase
VVADEECTLWNAVDITERKRAEEELANYREHLEELVEERSRALESSRAQLRQSERLASIGTLAAGIAHEINNPVGLIHLSSEYALSSTAEAEKDDVREEALRTCLQEAKRAGEIVHNILRFAGGGTAERSRADLREIVCRSEKLVAAYKRVMNARVTVELGDGPLPVHCSQLELEQVFVNVIRNAIESREGRVSVEIRCSAVNGAARVEVIDNGCGIKSADLSRLFDPFFSTRTTSGGSGLGLSVAHGIITAHEGRIWAESELDKGTRIVMELALLA